VLALYSSGRTTGVVIDSGDSVTHTVPIFEGYALPHAIQKLEIGGRDITEYLNKLVNEAGYQIEEIDIIKEMKEKHCYIAQDYESEIKNFTENKAACEKEFPLPDGNKVVMGTQRFKATETLFQP